MIYVDDVADAFCALVTAPDSAFAKHRFFNTGGDRVTIREIADTVRRIIPDAQLEVEPGGHGEVMGYPTRLSDRGLREEVGFRRRFTPLEAGVRAYIQAVREAPRT
jgi:UDP-glucose 4-epimerase